MDFRHRSEVLYEKTKKLEIRKDLGENVSEHDNVKREQIYSFI